LGNAGDFANVAVGVTNETTATSTIAWTAIGATACGDFAHAILTNKTAAAVEESIDAKLTSTVDTGDVANVVYTIKANATVVIGATC
jgi:hypothetical protein